jgi:regulator of replication initiation timing
MRILRIVAENIKRLKVVDFEPNKYMVRLSGANGAGKSSVLDAIEYALVGTKTVPTMPVRKGSGKAIIKLDLGDIVVTRRMTEGSPKRAGYLTIEGKDGKVWKDPDEVLRSLMGAISFDPLAFLNMEPKKQFDTLAHIAMPDVSLDDIEIQAKADYDQRTVIKKERDALQLRRDAIHVPADLPEAKYDEAALIKDLQQASEYNTGLLNLQRDRDKLTEAIERDEAEVASNRTKAEELRAQADNLDREALILEVEAQKTRAKMAKWEPLPEPKNSADLAEQINHARIVNAAIDRAAQRSQLDEQIATKQTEWEGLDEAVKRGVRKKDEALALAKYPIEGLGFDTGKREVIYNSLPFDQASHAEQMKTSMAIGMAINPKLRIMRIKDGSLLDDSSLAIIAEMAQAQDFQVWLESVSTTGKVGIYLSDGEVAAINDEPLNDEPKVAKPKTTRKKKEAASV